MNLDKLHSVHMLGIGGIGMSALARYFLKKGLEVSGYDRVDSEMTRALRKEGVEVHFEDDPSRIPEAFLQKGPEKALLIHSLAIGKQNRELVYLGNEGFPIMNRAQVLGEVSKNYRCIAVAGTHGKTTTACMLTSILKESGFPCHALLGGISADLDANVLLEGEAEHLVVEADEYGRSFLELDPEIGVVTAMEADHLDIYEDHSGLQEAFFEFQRKIPSSGSLFLEESVPAPEKLKVKPLRFGTGRGNDVRIEKVHPAEGFYAFDLQWRDKAWKGLRSRMPGLHNVIDLSAAIAVSDSLGIGEEALRKALDRIQGVRRRFEYRYEGNGRVLIDDYAHHPSELRAVIRTARELYPDREITGVFQPHLYSRTRDHVEGFALALSELDELFLLPIYPAREEPIPGVRSEILMERMKKVQVEMAEKGTDLRMKLAESAPEVLMVLGAGDVADELDEIADMMEEMAESEKGGRS